MIKRADVSVTSNKLNEELRIDGKLTEATYSNSIPIELVNSKNGMIVTDENCQTRAWVFHDDRNFYIAFECTDRHIWTNYTDRDQHLWKEEAVEVFIDTDDRPNDYVEIEVSPVNILFDSYIVDPKNIDVAGTSEFDLDKIRTAVSVIGSLNDDSDNDKMWQVEIAIPLNELVKDYKSKR